MIKYVRQATNSFMSYFINCTFVSSGLNLGQLWSKSFWSNASPGLGRTVCGLSSREAEVGR